MNYKESGILELKDKVNSTSPMLTKMMKVPKSRT